MIPDSLLRAALYLAVACTLPAGLTGCRGPAPASAPLISSNPYVEALAAAGWKVPADMRLIRVFTVSEAGTAYDIFEHETDGVQGLAIFNGQALVTDPDLAYRILQTYAWLGPDAPFGEADLVRLSALRQTLADANQRYAGLFGLADALAPITRAVEHLKDIPVSKVPDVIVKGFPLVQVRNAWDLFCLIPVSAADLCILEPAVTELHDQAVEFEALLATANADLDQFAFLLDSRNLEQPPTGEAIDVAGQKSFAGLRNLLMKVDSLNASVTTFLDLNQKAITVLSGRQWGRLLGLAMSWLRARGVPVDDLADGLVDQLTALDTRLTEFLIASGAFADDVFGQMVQLDDTRSATETRILELGQQWRVLPGGSADD